MQLHYSSSGDHTGRSQDTAKIRTSIQEEGRESQEDNPQLPLLARGNIIWLEHPWRDGSSVSGAGVPRPRRCGGGKRHRRSDMPTGSWRCRALLLPAIPRA